MRRLGGGLLHASHHVRTRDAEYVLQRVSDVFAPEIHANIEAVTAHLSARGCPTPRLLRTIDGELSAALGSLGRWRLMTHLGGASFTTIQSIEQARSAGALVGRFQAAMRDFDRPLAPMGIPYRNTPAYLAALEGALARHGDHRLAPSMTPLARRVFEAFEALGPPPEVRKRVIHGDLKLQNVLFESRKPPGRDRAFALIDLDTLMWAPLWVELGDAWRSWCNPAGEEGAGTRFDMRIFEASLAGFLEADSGGLSPEERESLVSSPERLTLELCARYVTDALEESYFGWNESAYPGRGEHNAARALGQWRCFEAAGETRAERAALLRSLG
jgi:Ser/Thr protein kinase RdoA (MazF antagonist)